ncbi:MULTISPECIES: hypothetical protein [unclassified Cryobacterium]|uniref:hypothetical protein n=1 Tax=unclassified Cryobacterium TaxID=2649013 RepID=UPI002AB4E9C8|nr:MULTISPECIES: hypothetical protein [unclassified Cryobacterium]MDY7527244.1 hypothetical protein [Cryobacterium sp. 10C2]MDY7556970.1 hypothetical protein [Cryobacterium sp. 10C3]MEB0002973.1 hypothetical protein [Cryobacterium sp. RTC2.1]MEB0201316.1 hypothetical protein [Cryobacterium sp. 5I3]MEB0285887.1 hypothetical protein [Cryobacterium sp. 10S3]
MNDDDKQQDPVARLRAADPAGDIEARAGFADEVVARMTGPEAEPMSGSAPVADLETARARRRPRWLPFVAVAASIAIVGAAGYGIGASEGGPKSLADGAAPPITLQSNGRPDSVAHGGMETSVGSGAATDQKMSSSTYPHGSGRNAFSASGLGTQAGTAQAYAYDPRSASSSDKVTALAAALGIGSPAELRDGSWVAGPQDGSAPSLSVSLDGMLSFYFQNPQINPWKCEGDSACEPTGQPPSEDAAIGALRALLAAAGRDPAEFEFTSQVSEGSPTRTVTAKPVIDGQQVDQGWSLEMAEGGVVNANGALADVIALGTYPVVSEQEGFERLSDPRFSGAATSLPIALRDQASTTEEWVAPTEPPATPVAGTSVSWPVNKVEIVSARLGLTTQWQPDGSVLVVPAFAFTDAEGGTWSVLAVAESKLDFRAF